MMATSSSPLPSTPPKSPGSPFSAPPKSPLPAPPQSPTNTSPMAQSKSKSKSKSNSNSKDKRVSTIDHLLRNPPPELAAQSDAFLDRFPSLATSSPSLVQLFRKTAPSAAKRQSVMNLPANLVSERQAYFEGEIAAELAQLENSKEWFDIQKYVESYFGITLVTSSSTPPVPVLPPTSPMSGSVPPPLRSSPPKSAPPRTPTPTGRPTTPTGRPTTPTGRPTTPTLRPATPPAPRFGVHPSLARCTALLADIAATWAQPRGKDHLTLAAPISEFMFHYKSANTSDPGLTDLVDVSLLSTLLSAMEAADTDGGLADKDLDAWHLQITSHLLSPRVHAALTQLEADQKRTWVATQLAKVRHDVFLATVKHLSAMGAVKKRADEDHVAALRSGAVLVRFIKATVDVLNARALHEYALPQPLVDADEAARVLTPHEGAALVDATRNWMAVARGALKYLQMDLAADWHVKVLTLGSAKGPLADAQIELVTALLGARFAQVAGTPIVDVDAIESLREYLALVHPESTWPGLAPMYSRAAEAAADVAITPHAATRPDGVWTLRCPLAKHTVATARVGAAAAKVFRAADVKGAKATWHFQRYLRLLDLAGDGAPEGLARATHLSLPDMLPPVPLATLPRAWMPMTAQLVLHLDPRDTAGALPLETYFARAYTFQPVNPEAATSSSGVLRVDRDRAYVVNRLLLQVFARITRVVCDLHEHHGIAHGALVPSHVLLGGDPTAALASLDPKVRVLPSAFDLPPPRTYVPGQDNGGYDSTLADDVRDLGNLFARVMDVFWYRRPLVSPTVPDPPEVVRRSMSEPVLLESVPEGLPLTPSLEMHQERQATLVRQSTGSFASSSEDSLSRPGSAALGGRTSRTDSVMDAAAPGATAVSAPTTPGRREGAAGKKKKRPITIHLAPSIHPPWSPLYNEAATTVIPRPDTPEPARAQLAVAGDDHAKDLPPVPPVPGATAEPPQRSKTPTIVGELASNDQDRRMNEIYEGLMALVERMRHKDETMRPVVREVLEHF